METLGYKDPMLGDQLLQGDYCLGFESQTEALTLSYD